jgi:hypothetical protein
VSGASRESAHVPASAIAHVPAGEGPHIPAGAIAHVPAGEAGEGLVRRGGVLLRVDGGLCFVPATLAVRVAAPPRVTSIPGAPPELLGVAPHDGMIVPVIAIGSARREMIVCQHAGELVGLVGGEVVRTGSFDGVPGRLDVVEHEGHQVPSIDLVAIYRDVQARASSIRWAR